MTYHEFASEAAIAEIRRVLGDGGRLVVVGLGGNRNRRERTAD